MTLDDLHQVLLEIRDEIRGLRADARRNSGLPDVKIGKNPSKWNGPSYEGRTASECPASFLLEYASLLEWKASKQAEEEGKEAYAKANAREAAICRRWATVNRDVEVAPKTQDSRRSPVESATEPPRGWSSGTTWGQRKAQ